SDATIDERELNDQIGPVIPESLRPFHIRPVRRISKNMDIIQTLKLQTWFDFKLLRTGCAGLTP
ncbi:hypothetical protein, partial [Thiolapillus sp.]|uniref:hypothetical protein n=1 Tax=Thiolapillus sp. TaxID=2017437 RepID=UPI003AF8539B